jgi:hypothetical protein
MSWILEKIEETFDQPLAARGFSKEKPLMTWWAQGYRYSKGNLGVSIAVTAESSSRIEIWLRHLGPDGFRENDFTWSPEDIELPVFCARQGLPPLSVSPSLGTHPVPSPVWDEYFKQALRSLLSALELLPIPGLDA